VLFKFILDAAKAIAGFRTIEQRVTDLRPALFEIQQVALDSIRQTFAAGGRPQRWVALRSARQRGSLASAIPLNDTGRLRSSIAGRIQGANQVVLGTNVKYAAIHNYGGTINVPALAPKRAKALRWMTPGGVIFARRARAHPVRIPARPFMVLQQEDESTFRRIVESHLTRGVE
jgi:phage gpG-like protein